MKSCYIVEEETNSYFDSHDEEIVYVSMKDDSSEDEKIVLIPVVVCSNDVVINP